MGLKQRSSSYLAAVRRIVFCVICNATGVQAAHRNEGKGMGSKASDFETAALCPRCHYEIDNGRLLSKSERRELMDRAIADTKQQLKDMGILETCE